ncbi:MAG TPA: porin [Chitinophagales bacterium]|nr:porin [Chitinophagales bacterium]
MKKISVLSFVLLLGYGISFGQFTITHGWNSLQLGGYLIGFYQYQPAYKGDPNAGDYHKNTFRFDDARLQIKGYVKGAVKYELEANLADIIAFASNPNDPQSIPLTEANIRYENPYLNVKVGYFKLPFSASSNVDKIPSPFMRRAEIANGTYFSRRDVGFMLYHDIWRQHINIMAGIVSGVGEGILLGKGDVNGKPEYFGRVELCSSYYRDEELDKNNLALPLARVGAGFRYNEKSVFTGDATGSTDYNIGNVMTINGVKLSYGADAAFMWHGFSAQFEMDWSRMKPHANTPLATSLAQYNTNYYRNGGFLVQANYYSKLLRSAFAVRYDEFNPSDLVDGNQQRTVSFAYDFFCLPYNLTVKVHYDLRLKQPDTGMKWTEDDLRIGVQYVY